jgi:ELWxxDGT repeat protein
MKRLLALALLSGFTVVVVPQDATAATPENPGHKIADVDPESAGVELGGRLYFDGRDAAHGAELWSTDGTAAGTQLVTDISPGAEDSTPRELTVFAGRLWFSAYDPTYGDELWSTDGTAAGTRRMRDINPGPDSSIPQYLTVAGGLLYFDGTDADGGSELWYADASGGVSLANDLISGPDSSIPVGLTALGDEVVFSAYLPSGTRKMYAAGPSPTQLQRLDGTLDGLDLFPRVLGSTGSAVVFTGNTPHQGFEPWVTHGQAGDARPIDLEPGTAGSNPGFQGALLGGRLYFLANTAAAGAELWSTDGSDAGTTQVADLRQGSPSSFPTVLAALDGQVLFAATPDGDRYHLYSTRGTAASTTSLATLGPQLGTSPTTVQPLQVGREIVFVNDDDDGREPWVTDGTAAGTRRLADLDPGSDGSFPSAVGSLGSTAVLGAAPDATGYHLYAWTAATSTTTVRAKRHYSARAARRKRVTVEVMVAGGQGDVLTGGTVTLALHGKVVGTAPLVNGTARIRITRRLEPSRKRAKKYAVTATWSGSLDATASTSVPATFKVKPRKRRHHR